MEKSDAVAALMADFIRRHDDAAGADKIRDEVAAAGYRQAA